MHNNQSDPTLWQPFISILLRLIAYVLGHRHAAAFVLIISAVAGASAFAPEIYMTMAGEWRTVTLSDNSIAKLGPRTAIVVGYGKGQRSVRQFGGEATYQVAKDANRPFRVKCGDTTVQAIGTKFGVSCAAHTSNVVVAEGTVSVLRRIVGRGEVVSEEQVRAEAGHRVLADRWTPLMPRPVDAHIALAWERQRIFFSGTPVEEAIGEFNRRHRRQIPIPSYDGENYRIFGEFDLGDPGKFEEHLEKTIPKRELR